MPYGTKACPTVGCPAIISTRTRRCDDCARDYEQRRGSRQDRGYDAEHDRRKAEWQRRIDRGEQVFCARACGTPITGTQWDLGHSDDRTHHTGPECIRCNRRAGGAKGHQAAL